MALGLGTDFRFDIFARDRSQPAWRGVESSIQRAQRGVEGFLRAAGPLLGLGGAVSAGALAFATREALEYADALVQAADRTSFAVEELEALRYSGRLNRVEFAQVDMAMQRFSRRLAEAANGSGELFRDLEALGIRLRDSEGRMRSSYEILLDYADAVKGAESEQEQLRLAFKAFDSEGAALVNVMREGRDGLSAYRAEGERLGMFMGDELARDAADAATAFERMNAQFTADRNRTVAEYAEELEGFAQLLSDIARLGFRAAAAVGALYANIGDGVTSDDRLEGERLRASMLQDRRDDLFGRAEMARENRDNPNLSESVRRTNADLYTATLAGLRQVEQEIRDVQGGLDRLEQRRAQIEAMRAANESSPADAPGGCGGGGSGGGGGGGSGSDNAAPALPPPVSVGRRGEGAMRFPLPSESGADPVSIADAIAEELPPALQRERDRFADEFAYTFAGGIRAAADGDALEFFGRRLQDVLYSRLFDVFEELGKQIWQSTQGGGETGGFLASVGSAVFGGGKAMGGPVQPGKFYAWQEQGREYFAPTVPGKVIPESAMHGRGGPVVVNQFHLHAEGAVMTDELLREMDAKAEAAGRTAVAVSRNDLASIRKRQSRRLG